ncbi:MAG: Asp-tRNA(Asn)/Glu-tRNA(Gln) amidotransferase subunit GatC [Thermoanaerobaculia bacterium]
MISPDEVRRVAVLARLELDGPELEAMVRDLSRILDYVEQLADAAAEAADGELALPLRDDTPAASLELESIERNAPSMFGGFFVVPPVLGGEE